jgi:hypothetical protein
MSLLRQQILILHLIKPDLNSPTIAWAMYDGTLPKGHLHLNRGDQTTPPYHSVLEAMQDGWFVIQLPTLPYYLQGEDLEVGQLPYEYILERRIEFISS